MNAVLSALALVLVSGAALAAPDPLTRPLDPKDAARWLGPQTPLRLYGDSYYVGFKGVSLALIHTKAGLILIDGGVPQSVAAVEANIRKLGFRVQDIRYILNTESHWDHASGIAALSRDSGAIALTGAWGAKVLRTGTPGADDPQHANLIAYPAVRKVGALRDGQTVTLGGATVVAHATPGHTPGSTSYSWRSCEAGKCRSIVFSSSFNPVAADGFRYTGGGGLPDITPSFRASIRKVGALPCDILISAHPEQSGLDVRMAQAEAQHSQTPFTDPNACKAYAAKSEALLNERIAKEKSGANPARPGSRPSRPPSSPR